MQLRSLIFASLFAASAALGLATAAMAAPPGSHTSPTDLYISPQTDTPLPPTGGVNVVPGVAKATLDPYKTGAFTTTAEPTTASGTTNLLGCGGIGQTEYTNALYNMPESFTQFQQDVDSQLSKQILTMNYIMPQTAALFDQLNNYGNQRYQTFQKGCQITALQQDARNQYINACMSQAMIDARKAIINNGGTAPAAGAAPAAAPAGSPAATMTPQMIDAMAYAQAYEICSNNSVSNTTALASRTKALQDFATQTRAVENVTAAIQPLICDFKGGTDADQGCWPAMLLPQVRLCLGDTMEGGCNSADGYGARQPLLAAPRLMDTMRYILDDMIVARRVMPFHQVMNSYNVDGNTRQNAAREAALGQGAAAARVVKDDTSGDASTAGSTAITTPPASVIDFQINYMNCKEPDIMMPLRQYAARVNDRLLSGGGGKSITITALAATDYRTIIDRLALDPADEKQKKALTDVVWASMGCTANQAVPMLDPNLTYSLNSCEPADRYAFYTMAENDVALSATRDIYRYLNMRLKQAYARLVTQGTVPSSPTTVGAASTSSPTFSPEINNRLATAVKEVMIPYVEGEITRLNEMNATRGEFGLRVQQIYSSKKGCMFTPGSGGN